MPYTLRIPLALAVRVVKKEMIIKKGGEDFLNYEIKRITPLKNYKSRIVLKNKELL